MPADPNASFAPNIEVDDSKKWVLKLVALDEQPSQYRDKRKDAMMLIWKFLVYDLDTGIGVADQVTGDLYEQWLFTGDLTYDNPTSGKIAPARETANALMGKRLSDDDVRQLNVDGWAKTLVGKMAVADLEWYSTTDGTERLRILRLKPYRKPEPPAPEPVAAAPAPSAPRRGRTLDDE